MLIAARLLQGVAAAAGIVLARAVIIDRFHSRDTPRYFALLAQILAVAPVVAPVLGGAILPISGWRIVFVMLSGIGVLLLLGVLTKVPETLPRQRRHADGLVGTLRAMRHLLADHPLLGNGLVLGFAGAAMFAYINGSSFVFEHLHGVSTAFYSLIFAVNAVGILTVGTAFSRLSRRVRLNTLLHRRGRHRRCRRARPGACRRAPWRESGADVGGPVRDDVGYRRDHPCHHESRTAPRSEHPGAASALLGGLQFGLGAITSPLVDVFGENSSLPTALIMLTSLVLAVFALAVLVRPREGHGEVTTR
ncbi:MAG: MFS transporter [Nocardioidaceae bacterium]